MPKVNGEWVNEVEMQERLIYLCGGRAKTEQLQRIWNNSYPHSGYGIKTKEDDFRRQAKEAGYKEEAIELFIIS